MTERFECTKRHCKWTGAEEEKLQIPEGSQTGWRDLVCPTCHGKEFYLLPAPTKNERVNHANELIKLISTYGRKFFKDGDYTASLEIDKNGKIWFLDSYTRRRIYTHYSGDWRGFSSGGTLRNLIIMMRDYIRSGRTLPLYYIAPLRNRDDGSNIWGYEQSEANKLRDKAILLPIITESNLAKKEVAA